MSTYGLHEVWRYKHPYSREYSCHPRKSSSRIDTYSLIGQWILYDIYPGRSRITLLFLSTFILDSPVVSGIGIYRLIGYRKSMLRLHECKLYKITGWRISIVVLFTSMGGHLNYSEGNVHYRGMEF